MVKVVTNNFNTLSTNFQKAWKLGSWKRLLTLTHTVLNHLRKLTNCSCTCINKSLFGATAENVQGFVRTSATLTAPARH